MGQKRKRHTRKSVSGGGEKKEEGAGKKVGTNSTYENTQYTFLTPRLSEKARNWRRIRKRERQPSSDPSKGRTQREGNKD